MKQAPPLLVLAVCLALMWLIAPAGEARALGQSLAAALLALTGVLVAVAGVVAFRRAGTTVDPRVPHKAGALVTRGIYRLSRNPMYVGMLLLLLGWAVLLGSGLAALVCPLFYLWIDRLQIPFEERHIRALFGKEYDAYRQRVRRWL